MCWNFFEDFPVETEVTVDWPGPSRRLTTLRLWRLTSPVEEEEQEKVASVERDFESEESTFAAGK